MDTQREAEGVSFDEWYTLRFCTCPVGAATDARKLTEQSGALNGTC